MRFALPLWVNRGSFIEAKLKPKPTDPFPFYGLTGAGLDFRHSREGGNPDD